MEPITPAAMLDTLRDKGAAWSLESRERWFNLLVARFPAEDLFAEARRRLGALGDADAETVLRLFLTYATFEHLTELADALRNQPDLPAETAWEALEALEEAGLLEEMPELAERWEELEGLDAPDAVERVMDELAAHLEDESEGVWLALEGFAAIEPPLRPEILAELGRQPTRPNLVAFLRALTHSPEPETRRAAVDALERLTAGREPWRQVWADLALSHEEPDVVERALAHLGPDIEATLSRYESKAPRLIEGVITAVDGRGRASIALTAELDPSGRRPSAVFLCDVRRGVVSVLGQEDDAAGDLAAGLVGRPSADAFAGLPDLAVRLLASCLNLGPGPSGPAVRHWVETVLGTAFRPRAFGAAFDKYQPENVPFDEMTIRAELVLSACPDWLDLSPKTYEMAEEIQLREGGLAVDPTRDAGAYRYLFEHRLQARLDLYRQMLVWMAALWDASGDRELARSALTLAWQLTDPQHVVPSHPFTVALTTRSLARAVEDLRRGHDPRVEQGRKRPRGR